MTLKNLKDRISEIESKWPNTDLDSLRVLVKIDPIPKLFSVEGHIEEDLFNIKDIVFMVSG